MADDIIAYLEAIDRDACYRVESVLKESPLETTELVSFVGANGAKQGPYVRKRFDAEAGLGAVCAHYGRPACRIAFPSSSARARLL